MSILPTSKSFIRKNEKAKPIVQEPVNNIIGVANEETYLTTQGQRKLTKSIRK